MRLRDDIALPRVEILGPSEQLAQWNTERSRQCCLLVQTKVVGTCRCLEIQQMVEIDITRDVDGVSAPLTAERPKCG